MPQDPTTNPSLNESDEAPPMNPTAENGTSEAPAPTQEAGALSNANDLPTAGTQDMDAEAAVTTEPLAPDSEPIYRKTIPLEEAAGTVPLQPLELKTVLDERYRIDEVLGNTHGTNVYRATDLQGYRLCWACGSDASQEGDTYCVDCGAQLTG